MTQRRAPDPDWGLKGVPWLLWVGLCQPVEQTGRTFLLVSIHLLLVPRNVPACALFCLCACASVVFVHFMCGGPAHAFGCGPGCLCTFVVSRSYECVCTGVLCRGFCSSESGR